MSHERRPPRADTTSAPVVDVAIPTYRRPHFLREAIESVVSQSFDRWRLLISSDGPPDDAVKSTVEPFLSDPRVSYRAHDENVGVVRNKNALLESALARYVAVLDDDDRWEPDFLARRVDFLDAHPECGFVFSGYVEIDGNGHPLRQSTHFAPEGVLASSDVVPRLLMENAIRTPTVLVRGSAYDAVGKFFDERFPSIYDWEMWIRLSMRFPVGYLGTRDSGYRVHRSQETLRFRSGDQALRLIDEAELRARRMSFTLRLDDKDSRRIRAFWAVSAALDALERGERRVAAERLVRAGRLSPRSLVGRRGLAAAAGVGFGRRVGRFVGGPLRDIARRRARRRGHP